MAESELGLKSPPNPNSLIVSAPPATTGDGFGPAVWLRQRPKIRVTTEFDSDTAVFFHRISCKVLDSFAKLKFSFHNNGKGELSDPQLALTSKYLSLHYDIEEKNALVNASFDVAPGVQFKAIHEVKSQQGELAMVADLAGPAYKLELSSAVPSIGMPRATLKFPLGEVSVEEKEEEEEEDVQVKRILSVNGILRGQILNGVCTAKYKDEALDLRYCFKDEQMTFIPSISLPSNAMSFAFKRQFGPSDKLSYWYNLDTNYWSTVYKHNMGKDFKFKAGYDSEVRLGWASLWVGEEDGKAKTAPMKMKVQFMLQVPQDDIKSSAMMFRVKKRWDI
ncbi:Outer envelope pore protein 37, chloroplastic [Datura stramonium]|uniref:Outer envelope pore protein 37, chloroplastic n=1 Tax=Datura stramonium TaxID=4076 RepID=A0ABS8T5P6_DATST|nr:Outer envelope pore protein 37, chloroplastic [Datura stramonium]